MSQSAIQLLIKRDVWLQAVGATVGVFLVPVTCAAVLGAALALLSGVSAWVGALAVVAVVAPLAARTAWRGRDRYRKLLDGRNALLIQRWLDATRDPVEAARRRALYQEKGIAGTLPLVKDDFARDVQVQGAVKGKLRRRAANRAGSSYHELAAAAPLAGLVSGNGLPTDEAGLDIFGDAPGSTVNRDFLLPAHNPNTEGWTSEGTYQSPH